MYNAFNVKILIVATIAEQDPLILLPPLLARRSPQKQLAQAVVQVKVPQSLNVLPIHSKPHQ